jgi:hypothetical protein
MVPLNIVNAITKFMPTGCDGYPIVLGRITEVFGNVLTIMAEGLGY